MALAAPLLICLMGPTASGKTDLAINLARQLDCELISVDSALVYRGLDIGSAKPDFPHHLINIRDPAEAYSAAEFATDADTVVADIVARGKTPLLVGGSMLYFKAFLEGLAEMPPADLALRQAIEAEAAALGWPSIHQQLLRVDPEAASRIHPQHSQRLSRALEVYRASGKTLTEWQRDGAGGRQGAAAYCRVVQIAICPADRAVLHRRIERRFAAMMASGLLAEVRALWQRPDLHEGLPAMRAVGYRQLWRHLAGESSLQDAVAAALAATRQLAKRQLTWLRKWPDLKWIYTDHDGNVAEDATTAAGQCAPGEAPLGLAMTYLQARGGLSR
ncbi:MAG: tRNA (adenosine(37)-N6)-dimethylallyltransferase MiaA [Halioglobus sp.]|nr:tRNA (adenosine(37)-N6)-dimethylallyltransferase MiaA [Halioglobus sp.]